MLSYTSEETIRKYFDTDETLSPEQIDAIRTVNNLFDVVMPHIAPISQCSSCTQEI